MTQENGNERKRNTPFQRVRTEEIEFLDERLKNNTYVAKVGGVKMVSASHPTPTLLPNTPQGGSDENSYGFKAHNDLIVTKGKGFRTEKNKKKRGSYRGGQIDFISHSIKFNFDD
ncbi:SRP40, C-terminal domain-containing protein [Jimgerdemannia flammicorona]|uniref:SRP40, C-terminal domain-containing protein n=1 Tax=Jimgerdemannia flammicorona TaxID=994334 RepID=A0A433QJ53_9FUNG|nr:SRP40, C-terminal domain-containing protein [Jimgerdemannia flammicorona]